ncbi:hypothetical protein GQ42DRAFT_162435 [Ramicandelaber brevisporus]|nr:hypothetical protein GQ42DRAFT_162435 [Ramicandelaber brevisporus]
MNEHQQQQQQQPAEHAAVASEPHFAGGFVVQPQTLQYTQLSSAPHDLGNVQASMGLLGLSETPAGDLDSTAAVGSFPVPVHVADPEAMRISQERAILRAQRKQAREVRNNRYKDFNRMMSKGDMEFISRGQLSQLVNSDPMTDDFYNQMYQIMKGSVPPVPSIPTAATVATVATTAAVNAANTVVTDASIPPLQQIQQPVPTPAAPVDPAVLSSAVAMPVPSPAFPEVVTAPPQQSQESSEAVTTSQPAEPLAVLSSQQARPVPSAAHARMLNEHLQSRQQSESPNQSPAGQSQPQQQQQQQQQHRDRDHHHTGGNRRHHHNNNRQTRQEQAANQMAQQMQRILEAAKRPKKDTVTLEGALGNIVIRSSKAPKQAISLARGASESTEDLPGSAQQPTAMSHRVNLQLIESVYSNLLQIEALFREQDAAALKPPSQEVEDQLASLASSIEQIKQRIFDLLDLDNPIGEVRPHTVIRLLSVQKGMAAFPRVLNYVGNDGALRLLSCIFANLDSLPLCGPASFTALLTQQQEQHEQRGRLSSSSFSDPSDARALTAGSTDPSATSLRERRIIEDAETFMRCVIPLVAINLSKSPLPIINGLLHLMVDRNSIPYLAMSKPGLTCLTLLLVRMATLRQEQAQLVDSVDLAHSTEVFAQLFNSLTSYIAALFPSTMNQATLGLQQQQQQTPSAESPTDSQQQQQQQQNSIPGSEDIYVWEFLAAMASCATVDQQRQLITEARDKILENIMLSRVAGQTAALFGPSSAASAEEAALRINSANIFLHTLGLDASYIN